jgi:hypothetical protein
MAKVVLAALLGAIVGGFGLTLLVKAGPAPVISVPMPQPGAGPTPVAVDLSGIVSKLALIAGVCSGSLIGALAGLAGSRLAEGSQTPRAWPTKGK